MNYLSLLDTANSIPDWLQGLTIVIVLGILGFAFLDQFDERMVVKKGVVYPMKSMLSTFWNVASLGLGFLLVMIMFAERGITNETILILVGVGFYTYYILRSEHGS